MSKDLVVELPKLKKEIIIEVNDDELTEIFYIPDTGKIIKIVGVFLFLIFIIFLSVLMLFIKNNMFSDDNIVNIKNIHIVDYDIESNEIQVLVEPNTKQQSCAVNDIASFKKLENNKCLVVLTLDGTTIYFKNTKEKISEGLKIDDFVVDIKEKKKYYISLNAEIELGKNLVAVGEPKIEWVSFDGILEINNNVIKGVKPGVAKVNAIVNNEAVNEIEIIVTDTIVNMPKEFDYNKKFLTCEKFTRDEAKLLDEILAYRISEAGYGTRAGAVAAARFLTLEFPYRISYYWESGRLNNTGTHYVDGEGRYYHKGLYLDKSKYKDIEASLFGPAMWGCKLMSYEDDPPNFIPGIKYPNGLDCSGFVTWSLFNGGFDVGDRGAGDLPTPGQLTDLGELKRLNMELINSGKIKVGDLFNFWGHISMLIGEDKHNYYVAESLNTYKGVVVMKYPKKKIMNTFKYVVLMDCVYKGDGDLTKMWY